ncbi:hypothetical protein [Streptomyces chartreusis]|uniref:WD40 repeat domain-containing protein n=1 Tax=Streptomyces chartreusis TaxID=1969 RepID=UPI002E80FB67|nr:hypothetical protein [Streptomyces chartreusis]WUB23823.1 hypothetical protein OG997_44640 [Streptomyces chartreusis]
MVAMTVHSPLITSLPPSRHEIMDFDLVTRAGKLTLVAAALGYHVDVCTWDPVSDRWTDYKLDAPAFDNDHPDLAVIGAAVVDGRIVVGGGGDHHGFATWDLKTGKVRLENDASLQGSTNSAVRADFGGRSVFVVGHQDGVDLVDPRMTESDEGGEDSDPEKPSPYGPLVDIEELECWSGASSAAAAGLWTGRPAVVARGRHGGVLVWDIEEGRHLAKLCDLGETLTEFALAPVDGRMRVVAAGGQSLVLGDSDSNDWGASFTVPGDEVSCLTAGTVHGRPLAVTGARDGTICVWDLTERRLLGQPLRGHGSEVLGLRMADLDSRPVIISSAHGDSVHLWEFLS